MGSKPVLVSQFFCCEKVPGTEFRTCAFSGSWLGTPSGNDAFSCRPSESRVKTK